LIARVEGKALAFAVVIPRVGILEVLYLAVDPTAWGTGLARKVLDHLRDHSVKEKTPMELWVIADNSRAIASYESAGWTRTTEVKIRNSSGRPERRFILTH
jgi:ribosomal protein S18 acetylase RimI-like enzyme